MSILTLNLAHEQFLQELLSDPARRAGAAYERVYGTGGMSAAVNASKLLARPDVAARLAELDAEARKRNAITVDQVVEHISQLAFADPRDLCEYRRGACRHCHGSNFLRQRTPQEQRDAIAQYRRTPEGAADASLIFFDYQGGVGFNPHKPAHPDCPECHGVGVGYEYFKDSRELPLSAARLYAGVKTTKDGVEIKTRSQDKAIDIAAKMFGLMRDKEADENSEIPPAASVTYEAEDATRPEGEQ